MLYYRSSKENSPGRKMSLPLVRLLATMPLITYPVGCIILLNAPEKSLAFELLGFAFILAALFGFAMIAPTYVQRITGEEKYKLDEFELDLRRKAYSAAYHAFTSIAMLFVIYLGMVSDGKNKWEWLWTPTTFDHWNAIFWGGFLLAALLPTVWIAWTVKPPIEEE